MRMAFKLIKSACTGDRNQSYTNNKKRVTFKVTLYPRYQIKLMFTHKNFKQIEQL
jgi:hypothetical protein